MTRKLLKSVFFICMTAFAAMSASIPSLAAKRGGNTDAAFTVVIDPGHGGKDYGCIGKITNEKTIVLDVARRLGDILNEETPEVKTVFTRKDDRFIPLNERAAIANRANSDLFISIHVNSVDRRTRGREKINGASVYTLGLHRSDDNLAVAMRENGVIELEPDFTETYQGFDPTSSESYIIFELTQNRHMRQSIDFADAVQHELTGSAGRADKGVRQSGFLVLRATSMPAVLIELDFICNPAAERFLASDDGRAKCARAIADAFKKYYAVNKHDDMPTQQAAVTATADAPKAETTYSVVLLSSDTRLEQGDPRLAGMPADVVALQLDGKYNYATGKFKSLKEAKKQLRRLKKSFPKAFIIKNASD